MMKMATQLASYETVQERSCTIAKADARREKVACPLSRLPCRRNVISSFRPWEIKTLLRLISFRARRSKNGTIALESGKAEPKLGRAVAGHTIHSRTAIDTRGQQHRCTLRARLLHHTHHPHHTRGGMRMHGAVVEWWDR
jgi:hypothetical protein